MILSDNLSLMDTEDEYLEFDISMMSFQSKRTDVPRPCSNSGQLLSVLMDCLRDVLK